VADGVAGLGLAERERNWGEREVEKSVAAMGRGLEGFDWGAFHLWVDRVLGIRCGVEGFVCSPL